MKKKYMLVIAIIITIILIIDFITSRLDNARIRNNMEPKYVIKIVSHDGHKVTYWGLGYKIIRYPSISPNEPFKNNARLRYGSWFIVHDLIKEEKTNNNLDKVVNSVKVIIDKKEYTLWLEDNETIKAFIELLPRKYNMNELNANEKYVYLDSNLPTDTFNPKRITAGDVMLYGNNCLVIFYKTFDTSYSYTKIGHIDNLPDLGTSSISVEFKKED